MPVVIGGQRSEVRGKERGRVVVCRNPHENFAGTAYDLDIEVDDTIRTRL